MNAGNLKDALCEMVDRYENDDQVTVDDVIDEAERLADEFGDSWLAKEVAKIRVEQNEELTLWGIRGDSMTKEEEFIEIVRSMATKKSPEKPEPEEKKADWDYTMVNDVIKNRRPYPAALIDKVVGAKESELPLLLKAGYKREGDQYVLGS